jgi:hypothetical protein
MESMRFRAPLRLRADGEVQEIATLDEAMDFLRAWPLARRGPLHGCAWRSCEAARAGALSTEDARKAIDSFARMTGISARMVATAIPTLPRRPGLAAALR